MRRKLTITAVMAAAMISSGASVTLAGHDHLSGFGGPPPGVAKEADNYEVRMAKILNLTDTQKSQIKALLDAEREQVKSLLDKKHESREQIKKVVEATLFDETAVRALAIALAQTEIELTVSRAKTLNKVNALLTPDQRELLANLLPEGK